MYIYNVIILHVDHQYICVVLAYCKVFLIALPLPDLSFHSDYLILAAFVQRMKWSVWLFVVL